MAPCQWVAEFGVTLDRSRSASMEKSVPGPGDGASPRISTGPAIGPSGSIVRRGARRKNAAAAACAPPRAGGPYAPLPGPRPAREPARRWSRSGTGRRPLRRDEARGRWGPNTADDLIARAPVRRVGLPEDLAAACSFLASEVASYITGQVFVVNGGRKT